MWIIIAAIATFLFYKLVIKFFIDQNRENKEIRNFVQKSEIVSPRVLRMIDNKDAEGLARLIVNLNLEGRDSEIATIIKVIDTKGIVFATKVDNHRNRIRKEQGLPPLRNY